jgi:hypothetical protein
MRGLKLIKLLAGVAGLSMFVTFLFMPVPHSLKAAEPVVLTVMGDGVEKEVEFTMADLEALPQKTYTYSGYNHWPALKVFKDMTGPTLQSILDRTGLKDNATLLKFKPSGGKYVSIPYTKEQLLDEPRYYFPEGEDPGDVTEWPPKRSEKGKVPVETIIALKDSKGRLCFGQRAPNEPTGGDCIMIQEMCNNGKIEVSTEALKQWDIPAAEPPSGKVEPGTKVELVKPERQPDNVMMYYTLDGSEPAYGSYIYNISYPSFQPAFNAPIPVNKKLTIKAKTIGFGRLDSELVTFEYDIEKRFLDTENHWAKKEIDSLVEKGIITGMTDTEFRPQEKITRAQFAKLLVTALGIEESKGAALSFEDMPAGAWYHDAVAAAVNTGLITGYSDLVFAPDENITREQMASIISRALQMKSTETVDDGDIGQIINKFRDKGDISPWARQGTALAVSRGIVSGVSADTFAPRASATRAEAAVMILRLYEQAH